MRDWASLLRSFRPVAAAAAALSLAAAAGCSSGGSGVPENSPPPAPAPEKAAAALPLDVDACIADKLPAEEPVRQPSGLGSWFPAARADLTRDVKSYLSSASPEPLPGEVVALIVPHAGFAYSGPVAAQAYRKIAGAAFDTVIIVGPPHRCPVDGISVEPKGSYATPLGAVPIDSKMAGALIANHDRIRHVPEAHGDEHCIQNQVPFLQSVLGKFRIVPVLISAANPDDYVILSEAIHWVAADSGKRVLLVASTDLSHFPSAEDAARADSMILDAFKTMDERYILDRNARILKAGIPGLSCAACGIDAAISVIMAAKLLGATKIAVLDRRNSFEIAGGGRARVVGYGACALYKGESEGMDLDSKKKLLDIARKTLEAVLAGKSVPGFDVGDPALQKHGGAFVTLKNKGELRGCIGRYPEEGGKTPLWQVVSEMALASALKDYRFDGEHPDLAELGEIEIEVSVLSVPRKVKSARDIVLGKHGVIVKKGFRQGTYLPQVALETGWNLDQFMSSLCSSKAGLPADAWKNDPAVEIWVYDADVFHE